MSNGEYYRKTELSLDDVRSIYRLIGEVSEYWDDPAQWRRHLLDGACELLSGNVGSIAGQTVTDDGTFGGTTTPLAVTGMSQELQRSVFENAIREAEGRSVAQLEAEKAPGLLTLFARFQTDGWATAARSDMIDDATHYASAWHREYRTRAGCDDFVMSVRTVDVPGRIEIMTIDRPPGSSRFTSREVAIITLLHDEVAPLVGVRLATEEHLSRDGLSKRLNEVLAALLDGQREKEIAANLGISLSTVHEYVGTLYRHFRVSSHARLMAYFLKRVPLAK